MQPLNKEQLVALTDAANSRLELTFLELEITDHIPRLSVGMVRAVMDAAVAVGVFDETTLIELVPNPVVLKSMLPRIERERLSTDELRDLTLSEIRRLAGPDKDEVTAKKFNLFSDKRLPSADACTKRLKMKWTEIVQLALDGEEDEAATSAVRFRADAATERLSTDDLRELTPNEVQHIAESIESALDKRSVIPESDNKEDETATPAACFRPDAAPSGPPVVD